MELYAGYMQCFELEQATCFHQLVYAFVYCDDNFLKETIKVIFQQRFFIKTWATEPWLKFSWG